MSTRSSASTWPASQPVMAGVHIPALDGIRGIAILLVLVLHATMYGVPAPESRLDQIVYRVATGGWIGVDLFFVLSGFLITGILYDAKGSPGYFRTFYARRCLRIFPLYYGFLILFLVVLPQTLPLKGELQVLRADALWYWTYLTNVLIAREGWPPPGSIGHFWSLAVEEQFYLFWPLVVFALDRRKLFIACIACILCSLLLRVGLHLNGERVAAYVLAPARMDAFAIGAAVAVAARSRSDFDRLIRWAGPVAGLSTTILVCIFVWKRGLPSEDVVIGTIGYTVLACLFGAVIVLAVTTPSRGALGRLLTSSFLVRFGRYSYAIYVFHLPLLYLRPPALTSAIFPTLLGSQLPGHFLFVATATGASLGVGALSWHLYERHFLNLKHLFPYLRSEPVVGTPNVAALEEEGVRTRIIASDRG